MLEDEQYGPESVKIPPVSHEAGQLRYQLGFEPSPLPQLLLLWREVFSSTDRGLPPWTHVRVPLDIFLYISAHFLARVATLHPHQPPPRNFVYFVQPPHQQQLLGFLGVGWKLFVYLPPQPVVLPPPVLLPSPLALVSLLAAALFSVFQLQLLS